MIISDHAKKRALERFDCNIFDSIHKCRLAGKNIKKKIRKSCPISAKKYMQGYNDRYFLYDNKSNVVFVIQATKPVHTIITVFQMI